MQPNSNCTKCGARRIACTALFLSSGIGLVSSIAESAAPTLAHLFPAGGQRGSQVSVTVAGDFPWPVQIWAPGLDLTAGEEKGKLQIAIPAQLPADRVWLRLFNGEGVSTAVPFMIGNLPEISEGEPNNSARSAQLVVDPRVTINGRLQEPGDVDAFAVPLEAGQTLIAEVSAHRLGSPMDSILQIVTDNGFVVAENHDEAGLDPRLAYTATDQGTYIVRLFAFPATPDSTIAFRGDASYIYRLTLTTGPFITHGVPLTVSLSDPAPVEVLGWNIPPGTRLPVTVLDESSPPGLEEFEAPGDVRITADDRLGLAFAPGFGGAARVRCVPYPVGRTEPASGESAAPVTITPPDSVTGRLRSAGQRDQFLLPLKQGAQVVISVESVSLHLPLVPAVEFLDPMGAALARIGPEGPAQDALITHTAATDGNYRLVVSDRYRHGKDRSFYRLTVRLEEPDFELVAGADAITVTSEQVVEVKVAVKRRGTPAEAVGAISVEAIDLPPGVTAAKAVSEATGPTASEITLQLTSSGTAYSGPIRIRGSAEQPIRRTRTARTPARFGVATQQIWLTAIAKPQ